MPRAQCLVPVLQSHPFFIVLEFLSWHTQAEDRDYTGQAPGAAVTISSTIHRRVTRTVWEFSFKGLLGVFSSTALSCYQELGVIDRHGGVSGSCCPTLEMKEQQQSAAWVLDPLPLRLCLQKWRGDLCCACADAILGLVTHSWALSYLLKNKECHWSF